MTHSYTVVSDLADIKDNRRPTFLAIGVFDGVHLGHQRLLQNMAAAARKEGARPATLTFFPHPSKIIRGEQGRLYICTLKDRVELLAKQGLELIITHTFDQQLRQMRAAEFVDLLLEHLNLVQLWGGNFALGYNQEGNLPFLRRLGSEKGFTIREFGAMVEWNGVQVSSSRVRRSLAQGNAEEASGCLGRHYTVAGTIVHGDARGRLLGIPTANLDVWDELILPASGVYATLATVQGRKYAAATNVGYRPTVNGHRLNVEAHLLDFEADIYGQEVRLEFVTKIRDEQKFADLDALVAQIRLDIEQVRQHLERFDQAPQR